MLKIAHSLLAGQADMKLKLSWKLSPHWLALMVLGGALQASGGESSVDLTSIMPFMLCYNTHLLAKMSSWCSSGMAVIEITNS